MFKKPAQIEDDIEWLEGCLETAEQYQSDIFDVVSTVKQVPMLDHNRNYINAIKEKISSLQSDLVESKKYYDDE
jgi:hypothetical protein